MNPPTEQLVRDYLNRLSLAARGRLGLRDRQALLEQTRARLEVAVGGLREATEKQVRQALATLGDPVALVDTERARISARKEAGIGSRFEGGKNGAVPHMWPAAGTAGSARWPALAEAEPVLDPRGPVAPGVCVAPAVAELALVHEAAVSLRTRPHDAIGAGHAGGGLPHRGHAEAQAGGNPEVGRTEPGRLGQVGNSGPARPAAAAGPAAATGENGSAGRAAGPDQAGGAGQGGSSGQVGGAGQGGSSGQVGGAGQVGNAGADGGPSRNGTAPEPPRPRPVPPPEMITAPPSPAPSQPESRSEEQPAQLEEASSGQDASSEPTAAKAVAAKTAAATTAAGKTAAGKTAAGKTRTGGPGHQAGSDDEAGQDSGIEFSGPAASAAARWLADLGSAIAARLARLGTELLTVVARDRLEAVAILLLGLGGAVYPPIWLIGVLVALSSRKWDHRDKWLGLGLPIPLVVFGATMVLLLGGQQLSMGHYATEAWLAAGRLSRIAVVLGAGYLLRRLHKYQGKRERRRPPWGPPHRRR